MRGRVAGRSELTVDEVAVEVADHHGLGGEVVIADAAGLDDQKVSPWHSGGHVPAGPGDKPPAQQVNVELGHETTYVVGRAHAVVASRLMARSRCIMPPSAPSSAPK